MEGKENFLVELKELVKNTEGYRAVTRSTQLGFGSESVDYYTIHTTPIEGIDFSKAQKLWDPAFTLEKKYAGSDIRGEAFCTPYNQYEDFVKNTQPEEIIYRKTNGFEITKDPILMRELKGFVDSHDNMLGISFGELPQAIGTGLLNKNKRYGEILYFFTILPVGGSQKLIQELEKKIHDTTDYTIGILTEQISYFDKFVQGQVMEGNFGELIYKKKFKESV